MTLGTNYHCEHHDFPTIPFTHLGKIRTLVPEFYRTAGMKTTTTTTTATTEATPTTTASSFDGEQQQQQQEPQKTQPQDNLWKILRRTSADPDYYACMNDIRSIR